MVSVKLLSASALLSLALAANNNAAASSSGLTLDASAVQKGSTVDGQESEGAEAGEAASQTSTDNFINICAGSTLTNGLQILTGSCNGIPMGFIPAKTTMISSIITFPQNGQTIASGQTFNITVQTNNLDAGSFTNADATYYAAPQALNGQGQVIGHTHVTVQSLGKDLNPTTPPDPTLFSFFKGINDPGNGEGLLSATVTGGLPPGNYRVCTLTSASNHQPVIMPVAQRGSQDDCTKFVVNGNNDTINAAANNGAKGSAAAAAAASAVALGPGAVTGGGTAVAAAASTTAATSGKGGAKAAGGKGKGKGAASAGTTAASSDTTTAAAAADTTSAAGKGKGGGKAGGGKTAATESSTAAAESATASQSAATGGKGGAKTGGFGGGFGGAKAGGFGGKGAGGKGEKRDCATEKRSTRLNRRHFVS